MYNRTVEALLTGFHLPDSVLIDKPRSVSDYCGGWVDGPNAFNK